MISGRKELRRVVREAVEKTWAADLYTRLDAEALAASRLHGLDRLLTDPALLKEASAYEDVRLRSDSLVERADAVYATLFVSRSPVSSAAQGALFSMERLGLPVRSRDLNALRAEYAQRPGQTHLSEVLDSAQLSAVTVRAGIFEAPQKPLSHLDARVETALCLDGLSDSQAAWPELAARGCRSMEDVCRYIVDRATQCEATCLSVRRLAPGMFFYGCIREATSALAIPICETQRMLVGHTTLEGLAGRLKEQGFAFRPFCSGARVAEQLPGLWAQARRALAQALEEAYAPLLKCGWRLTEAEIIHDLSEILSAREKGNYCFQIE